MLKLKLIKQNTLKKEPNFRYLILAFQKVIKRNLLKLSTSIIQIILFLIHSNFSKIISKKITKQQNSG